MNLPESNENDRTEMFLSCFSKEQRSIYVLIRSLLYDRSDVDEVFQETCVALWRDFHKYSPGTDFGAWARQVARYRVLAHGKKRQSDRHHFSSEITRELVQQVENEDHLLAGRKKALQGCIAKLDEQDQSLIKVRYTRGMTVQELAATNNLTVKALYKKLAKLRLQLAKCIDSKIRSSQATTGIYSNSPSDG